MTDSKHPNRTPYTVPKSMRKFLADKLQQAIGRQPELVQLREKLLAIGGRELVAPFGGYEPFVSQLLAGGQVMEGTILHHEMEARECHSNVAQLWLDRHEGMTGIGTGYLLHKSGLWYQHSWGLHADGILETTVTGRAYFGIRHYGESAQRVALEQKALERSGGLWRDITLVELMRGINFIWSQSGAPGPDNEVIWCLIAQRYGCDHKLLLAARQAMRERRNAGPPYLARQIEALEARIDERWKTFIHALDPKKKPS